MKLEVTVLGCGTSGGVPQLLSGYGACDATEQKNRRLRSSLLLSFRGKNLLVDTSPDLREQMLSQDSREQKHNEIDAVIYTHAHADHAHGIDDLRWFCSKRTEPMLAYSDRTTLNLLRARFDYAFVGSFLEDGKPQEEVQDRMLFGGMPVLRGVVVGPNKSYQIAGLDVEFMHQDHGFSESLGLRIGNFAYSTDVAKLTEDNFRSLSGVETWILDCLRYRSHPTHMSVDEALLAIARVKPKRAYLTHMNNELDYNTLCNLLPASVKPAFDGLKLVID